MYIYIFKEVIAVAPHPCHASPFPVMTLAVSPSSVSALRLHVLCRGVKHITVNCRKPPGFELAICEQQEACIFGIACVCDSVRSRSSLCPHCGYPSQLRSCKCSVLQENLRPLVLRQDGSSAYQELGAVSESGERELTNSRAERKDKCTFQLGVF